MLELFSLETYDINRDMALEQTVTKKGSNDMAIERGHERKRSEGYSAFLGVSPHVFLCYLVCEVFLSRFRVCASARVSAFRRVSIPFQKRDSSRLDDNAVTPPPSRGILKCDRSWGSKQHDVLEERPCRGWLS